MKVTFSRPHYHYYVFSNYILIFFCFFTAYLLLKKPRILQRCLFIHFWPKIEQKYLLLRKNNDKLSICCNFLGYIIHYIYINNIKYVLQVYLYRYISGADTGVRQGGVGQDFYIYYPNMCIYVCHVTIVAGHGLLKKCCPMVVGCVLRTSRSSLILKYTIPLIYLYR